MTVAVCCSILPVWLGNSHFRKDIYSTATHSSDIVIFLITVGAVLVQIVKEKKMDPLVVYCKKALEMGLDGAKVIDPRSIVTAEWVRMKCQFGALNYGMRHCCPPFTPRPEKTQKVIDSYQKAILLHKKLKEGGRGKGLMGFKGGSTQRLFASKLKFFLMGTTRLGAWAVVLVVSVRCAIEPVPVSTGMKQGLPWKHAALMSIKRQGVMALIFGSYEPVTRTEIYSELSWWSERWRR